LKVILSETNCTPAFELFEYITENNKEIICPNFCLIELTSVTNHKNYLKEVDKNHIDFSYIFTHDMVTKFHPVDEKILSVAISISQKANLPVIYDSIYLALAKENNSFFISEDKRFIKKAKEIYKDSYTPEEFM
jgi:predicted nucleic acid-binding protein